MITKGVPISVETRGNETFYKNGCLIWNHKFGFAGILDHYYHRFGAPIDRYYLDRIRKRDLVDHQQNRKNFQKRVKSKFERKRSFEANQRKDRNDELCYRPEPEEFFRKLSLEEKLSWADDQHSETTQNLQCEKGSKKRVERKRKSDSKIGDKIKFCKKRFLK